MKKYIELENDVVIETALKELKPGDYFTKKAIESPSFSQVWIKGNYCRDVKKYECYNYNDVNKYCYIPGNKIVYSNFIF